MKKMRALMILLLLPVLGCASEAERDLMPQRQLINESAATTSRLLADAQFSELKDYISRAKAVLIIPSMYRAGFVLGAEYGNAVLMVKNGSGGSNFAAPLTAIQTEDLQSGNSSGYTAPAAQNFGGADNNGWGNPIFYKLAGGSAGLQIGAQSAEIIITIMTDKGLQGLLNNSIKLGADASVAFGPIGKNVAAGTTATPPSADMYTFGATIGLYGGASLSGALLSEKANWNMLVYGANTLPRDVMLRSDSNLAEAESLRRALTF
jgi:lipid-binding SYLF domain-containing protein